MCNTMDGFMKIIEELADFSDLTSSIQSKITPINLMGVADSVRAHFISCATKKLDKKAFVVSDNEAEARRIVEDLSFFSDSEVLYFPSIDLLFYDIEATGQDIRTQRLKVLYALMFSPEKYHIVTTRKALCQITAEKDLYLSLSRSLSVGDEIDLDEIRTLFTDLGYVFESQVEGKGQCSIRGGIFDFFPPENDYAIRVELFDTEIDSIRLFSPESQRTVENADTVILTPAREIILTDEKRDILTAFLKNEAKKSGKSDNEIKQNLCRSLLRDCERVEEKINFPSIHKYIPVLYKNIPSLSDYIDENHIVFFDDPGRLSDSAKAEEEQFNEDLKALLERGIIPKTSFKYCKSLSEATKELTRHPFVGMSSISYSSPDYKPKKIINITSKGINDYHGKMEFFFDALSFYRKNSYKTIILAGTEGRAENLLTTLSDEGYNATYSKDLEILPENGGIVVACGSLSKGFEYPLIRTVIISDREIFGGRKKKKSRFKVDKRDKINSFSDLTVGDFVVHQNHGIGQYMGTVQLDAGGIKRDYLKLIYKGSDVLYVPTDQLSLVYKHTSKEGASVRLNTLGGADWSKTKQRVKKSCEDIADQLIALYAARESIKGVQCGKDDDWQRMFEAAFPYDETDDQLLSIAEVKADMEKPRPMDRLLCGDVGYGKTEVAMRAAFKAVMNGFQVAYLCPTTILASQHTNTFRQRMKDYPIRIASLSRFSTPAQQKEILKGLKSGEIDIVIGTHKLLSNKVEYKNLGLLVIDEEQRFGVKHKEYIKELRKNIDVLTLSATPIPRTLHMSMSGIRDMSVIAQPPGERYPIATYVLEYDQNVIREAIYREIGRGGQVYYLYNRVSGIDKVAEEISKMVPDAKIAVAHGQMKESELEAIMMDLYEGEIDILICTTIIETGLDIPNVNTIIIEDSDRLGLSQLYQLRGRVGRSDRLAYAYLTFRRNKVLTEDAEKRLRAVKEFTEFGSGFKIALRDLEIRGMGNLIGAAQSGHMEAVGYEMYCRMLDSAIKSHKGIISDEQTETLIDIPIDGYIPERYIPAHSQRLSVYKRIAAIETPEDLMDMQDELCDRYGQMPPSVENLLEISLIRKMASDKKFTEVSVKENKLKLYFDAENPPNLDNAITLALDNPLDIAIRNGKRPHIEFALDFDGNHKKYTNIIKKTIEKL
ncbi:MAG: transcription-repair coupling factor [Ruminococcaceae bacterium]|nr:transcription-repair coupling factor [Oscillospiraceae bacterium]